MEPDLTLIGTVHLDHGAEDHIRRLLEEIRPQCITVEISRFSVEYRTLHQDAWLEKLRDLVLGLPEENRGHARIRLLERQIRMPYEWTAARDYARRHGKTCLAVDSDELAREELPQWEHTLLTRENISALVNEPDFDLRQHFRSCHEQALQIIHSPGKIPDAVHPLAWLSDEFWQQRERHLAGEIRKTAMNKGPVVHIGGWMHLVVIKQWPTVARILEDLEPARLLARENA